MRYLFFIATLVALSLSRTVHAITVPDRSEPVPVSRLVENVSKYIKQHPKDAQGYYILARIHSIAFTESVLIPAPTVAVIRGPLVPIENQVVGRPQKGIKATPVENPSHYEKELPDVGYSSENRNNPSQPISSEDLYHLRESVRNYAKATKLEADDSTAWLGFGWTLELGAPFAPRLGAPWLNGSRRNSTTSEWINQALSAYRRSYELGSLIDDYNWGAVEAGEAILRLQPLLQRSLTQRQKVEAKEIRTKIEKIKKMPVPISPIVLPLGQQASLKSLLSQQKPVTFDLSGEGLGKSWPWVSADAGILVWDPQHRGRITSGRQLFGSVTWWIFWKNGYQALASLDNNVDSKLSGTELNGISIWRDANGNGLSDAGEVKPIQNWGITSLSTQITHYVNGAPSNLQGAKRGDGTTLPTYDWTPHSLN